MTNDLTFVIPNSSSEMNSSIAAERLESHFSDIFASYPALHDICKALAGHFLRFVPDAKRSAPLLDVCFRNAVSSYLTSDLKGTVPGFIKGLMYATPDVLHWSLYISRRFDGPVSWDCVHISLLDWIMVNRCRPEIAYRHEIQHPVISRDSFRELLCYKLIPANVILHHSAEFRSICEAD